MDIHAASLFFTDKRLKLPQVDAARIPGSVNARQSFGISRVIAHILLGPCWIYYNTIPWFHS